MNLSIRKSSATTENENIIVLTNPAAKMGALSFSKPERAFIQKQMKEDKKAIEINRFSNWVFVQVLEGKDDMNKSLENARKSGSAFCSRLNSLKIAEVLIMDDGLDAALTLAFLEGMMLGNYQFLKYRKEAAKERNTLQTAELISAGVGKKDLDLVKILVDATCKARDLVNEPVIYLTAAQLAKEFQKMGKDAGFEVEVLNKSKIETLKMGGLLAVNYGSVEPPTFTIMEWKPKKPVNKKPIVLVGKGVVYDTGGLSLKPTPNSMDTMKCDMAGSAAVGCAIYAAAKANLNVHVIALVPATDNRPGGNAYTPGDVIKMYSGLNVEVLNTDAEGRMILGDALAYAKKYDPELVMDFATLTGAAVAAIGQYGTVCMGNASEKIKNDLKDSGNHVHERLVEFPFWDDYDELIKSDIADIKNVGGPTGGAITAGKFLARFVDYPWMHFDIAGPAFIKGGDSYRGKNGTGVGVRLLFDYLRKRAK